MAAWWNSLEVTNPSLGWSNVTGALLTSVFLGMVIGQIHARTRDRHSASMSFHATLVLLTVLITLVTQVIGDNVARAFSLVGALSIVRFRTVVRDTKDTAFVIFAVVIGMCAGAGQGPLAVMGTILVGGLATIYRDGFASFSPTIEYLLTLKMGWSPEIEKEVSAALQEYCSYQHQECLNTIRQGTALEVTYRLQFVPGKSPRDLLNQLSQMSGVQALELRSLRSES